MRRDLMYFCSFCRISWPPCPSSRKTSWSKNWSAVTPAFCWISSQQSRLRNQDLPPAQLQVGANAPTAGRCLTTTGKCAATACQETVWAKELNLSFWYLTEWSYNWPISTPVTFGVTTSKKAMSTIGLLLTGSIPTGSMDVLGLAICGWSQVAVCGESATHTQTVMVSMLAFSCEGASWYEINFDIHVHYCNHQMEQTDAAHVLLVSHRFIHVVEIN